MVTRKSALLAGIDPAQVHEWYLAVHADAFEWTEAPNTLAVNRFANGGLFALKPYISSGTTSIGCRIAAGPAATRSTTSSGTKPARSACATGISWTVIVPVSRQTPERGTCTKPGIVWARHGAPGCCAVPTFSVSDGRPVRRCDTPLPEIRRTTWTACPRQLTAGSPRRLPDESKAPMNANSDWGIIALSQQRRSRGSVS